MLSGSAVHKQGLMGGASVAKRPEQSWLGFELDNMFTEHKEINTTVNEVIGQSDVQWSAYV